MKLLIITIDKFPHRGGKSTHISSLISGLEKLEVECEVFSGDYINNKEFNILKFIIYPIKFFSKKTYLYLRMKILINLFKKKLIKFIKNKEYDAVSFQDAISCGYCGELFDNNYLTMHTYFGIEYTLDNSGFTLNDRLYKKLLQIELKSLNNVNSIICVDERIKKHVDEIKNEQKAKITTFEITNFTNTDFFKPEKNKKKNKPVVLACIRRLVEKNGVIYAVKAMKKIDNCILKIYGEGPCQNEIQQYIKENKLENKVIMCGGIDNSELKKIYNKCDIVLVPSITVNGLQEATSISAIESMSCGIPTIASNIGGLPILIRNKETGLLVEEMNPDEIANGVNFLIDNNKIYDNIAKKSREFIIENHSHITAAKSYLKIFGAKNEKK